MTPEKFFEMTEETFGICRDLLGAKNKEYARNNDKLWNFKRAGYLLGSTPEKALLGMLAKHIISVMDYLDDLENNVYHDIDKWDEKIIDNINYLILLRGLLIERSKKEE